MRLVLPLYAKKTTALPPCLQFDRGVFDVISTSVSLATWWAQ